MAHARETGSEELLISGELPIVIKSTTVIVHQAAVVSVELCYREVGSSLAIARLLRRLGLMSGQACDW